MKCLYIVILFAVVSQTHLAAGMIRRSAVSLVGPAWLFGIYERVVFVAPKKLADKARGAGQELFKDIVERNQQACNVPFDRHTALKILRERRERECQRRK